MDTSKWTQCERGKSKTHLYEKFWIWLCLFEKTYCLFLYKISNNCQSLFLKTDSSMLNFFSCFQMTAYFIVAGRHSRHLRPFWNCVFTMDTIYLPSLIFNPRWLKHLSWWLNVDRAVQQRERKWRGKEEGDADPVSTDGSETVRISSRCDEYHSAASIGVWQGSGTHTNLL